MNGLTADQTTTRESLEGAAWTLKSVLRLNVGNIRMFVEMGDGQGVLAELSDAEQRIGRALLDLNAVLQSIDQARYRP